MKQTDVKKGAFEFSYTTAMNDTLCFLTFLVTINVAADVQVELLSSITYFILYVH